ncbi:Misato segment II tubulin-like domain-containing protein [Mycena rosella]|uniref:Misato segment II tubulin-like domain-containing protein n=1 Tax=Mycena rosella TaxID=1033263 RepID=A0AAD7CHK9_MYCRO|nr:Misato segment II tubulin-like domain-containing protein [Mycena rosella]
MKEILYIQAGSQANYAGTHFWNTQESYFTYGEEEDAEVSHGISFREGLNQKGEPTFCPRLLVFDRKAQFGTLSQANALFGVDEAAEEEQILWSGNPVEYKQEPVQKSRYQTDMEELDPDAGSASSAVQLADVRYWSDFNRMYYLPRTVQKVPDIPEWEDSEGNWTTGNETFTRYDEDTGLMEGPLRLFLEECETIQGIQLMHDTATFGSFVNSFLTSLRDDFVKLPLLSWPLLSDTTPSFHIGDDRRGIRKIINDALALRSLSELSSMTIPIQSPTTWTDELCSNTYMQASVCHSVRATFHSKFSHLDDISDFCAQLSWRSALPFAELGGQTQFGRRDVTRGFSHAGITSYNEWIYRSGVDASVISSSFPAFFSSAETWLPNTPPMVSLRPASTSVFSSIGVTSGTAGFFSDYAELLEDWTRRKISVENAGIDVDELGDLANDLWTLHDNAGGETYGGSDTDVRGEDEE